MSRTEISQFKRKQVFERDKGKCQMCGKELTMGLEPFGDSECYPKNYYTIDHIKPVSKGGKNNIDNLRLLCRTCNCSKHNREADDYINMLNKKIFNSFDYKNKELILKDYVKLGDKKILVDGLENIKNDFIKEINRHKELINNMEE